MTYVEATQILTANGYTVDIDKKEITVRKGLTVVLRTCFKRDVNSLALKVQKELKARELINETTYTNDKVENTTHVAIIFETTTQHGVLQAIRETHASTTVYELRAKTISEIAFRVSMIDISQYTKVLLVGNDVAKAVLVEKYDKMQNIHGCFFLFKDTYVMATYNTTTIDTIKYKRNDVLKFNSVPTIPELSYVEVQTMKDIEIDYNDMLFIDIETTGLDYFTDKITSIQILTSKQAYYLPNPTPEDIQYFRKNVVAKSAKVVFHNALFDVSFLVRYSDFRWCNTDVYLLDTMLMAKARGLRDVGLKHLASLYSKYNPNSYSDYKHAFNKSYAIADVYATRDVYERLVRKGIRTIDLLSFNALKVFIKARMKGMRVSDTLSDTVQEYEATLLKYANINWISNKQVIEVFIQNGVQLTTKTSGGDYSLTEGVLSELAKEYPIADVLHQYRTLLKVQNSVNGVGTIHGTINVLGTATGRTSSSNPNIQNIPNSAKSNIISSFSNGLICSLDLDRSELVCAVLLSGDDVMAKALLEYDYHQYVASISFGIPYNEVPKDKRQIAKIITFAGLLYGGSAKGIARQTSSDVSHIESGVLAIKKDFKQLSKWQDSKVAFAYNNGYNIDVFGKIRDFSLDRQSTDKNLVRRLAMNTDIQALSAYMCLILCVEIDTLLQEHTAKSYVITNVHDEVLIDVYPDEKEIVQAICTEAMAILNNATTIKNLPGYGLIKASGTPSFGKNWYEAKNS